MGSYGARLGAYEKSRMRTIERRRKKICTKCGKNKVTDTVTCESCLERMRGYKKKGKSFKTNKTKK